MHTIFRSFAALIILIGLTITGFVLMGRLANVDFNLMVKIQDHIPHRFDVMLTNVIEFGSLEVTTILVAILLVLLHLSKRVKLLIVTLYVVGLVVVLSGKLFISHPAPPFMFQRNVETSINFPSTHVQIESSFPSGHSYRSSFVLGLLILWVLTQKRKTSWKAFIPVIVLPIFLALWIALIVLGKHWVTDVAAGISLGFTLALFPYGLLGLKEKQVK